MEKEFRRYLEKKLKPKSGENYSPNTIYVYTHSIPNISKKYNKDIYQIESITELKEIRDELNTGGVNEKLGRYSHKTVYNAMARYIEFFEEHCRKKD